MITLRETSVRVVAGDAQEMGGILDQALLQQMRLATSFIEASTESKLAMPLTQPALQGLAEGLGHLVEGRAKLAASVREMNKLLSHSNLRETSFGCPNGLWMTLAPTREVVAGPEGVPAL